VTAPDRDGGLFVGVDFGGTTVTAGAVENGELRTLATVPTLRDRPPGEILETIAVLIDETAQNRPIAGIGVGVPCPAGPGTDRLVMIENIPSMEGYPFRTLLEERCSTPVALENDANCMAYGEHRAGALRGCLHCACLTLGTGLGCGIVIEGRLYRGAGNYAGEIWNIPWADGRTLEDRVSIAGLQALYRDATGETVEPEALHERYLAGDPEAVDAFERFGESVGQVAVMLISTLDPERIALGGGLSRAFDAFAGGMSRTVGRTWGTDGAGRIVRAELSGRAAVLGAAALAAEHFRPGV